MSRLRALSTVGGPSLSSSNRYSLVSPGEGPSEGEGEARLKEGDVIKRKVIKVLYYKNNQWHICEEKVRYIQHGEEKEQFIGQEGHQWWVDFANKWEHTEIVEFIPVEPTTEEIARLEEVNELRVPDGFGTVIGEYVESGVFPEGVNHPLRSLQILKENQQQGIDLSEREIQEIIQGQEISDLDIRVLMLEMGGN